MALRMVRMQRRIVPMDAQMHWSPILSGVCTTLGFGLFFLLLGNAIGLNALNTIRADISGALKLLSWIYIAGVFIFSYYIGAFLCTRSVQIDTPGAGTLHGLTSWALSTVVTLVVGSMASVGVRILLAGAAPNSANWLVVCIVGLGGVAAVMGGASGKYSRRGIAKTELERGVA